MRYPILLLCIVFFSCKNKEDKADSQPGAATDVLTPAPVTADSPFVHHDSLPTQLSVTALTNVKDPAQATFKLNDSTIFFFNTRNSEGQIGLNGKAYLINRVQFDTESMSYTLTGGNLRIETSKGDFNEPNAKACRTGKFSEVNIRLGNARQTIREVQVEICTGN